MGIMQCWEVRPSPLHGYGVFAKRPITQREVLGLYEGRIVSCIEYLQSPMKDYMMQVNNRHGRPAHYVDGTLGNWVTRINGAMPGQEATVNVEIYQYGGTLHCRSTRAINTGEELVLCYGPCFWDTTGRNP